MIRTRPGPERFRLGFSEAVQSAFGFLQQDYGFRCVEAGPTFVRYESDLAFVNIYHGRASYELGFEVGRRPDVRGQPESHYTMAEILQLAAAEAEAGNSCFQASTREGVQQLVPRLAALVRKYAPPALRGDPSTFDRLRELQSANSQRYINESRLARVREQAEEAWQKKWYPLVVRLYESIPQDLTRVEARRLEYARKHAGPDADPPG